jgi:hypothetical protein
MAISKKVRSLEDLIYTINELKKTNTALSQTMHDVNTTLLEMQAVEAAQEKTTIGKVLLSNVKSGSQFKRNGIIYIRLRPASFLLNSTLVKENLANGKVLIADIQQGTTFFVSGDELVQLL